MTLYSKRFIALTVLAFIASSVWTIVDEMDCQVQAENAKNRRLRDLQKIT